jgi:hypothetical protein
MRFAQLPTARAGIILLARPVPIIPTSQEVPVTIRDLSVPKRHAQPGELIAVCRACGLRFPATHAHQTVHRLLKGGTT